MPVSKRQIRALYSNAVKALRQRMRGRTVSIRNTPVFSVWPMRPKWEKQPWIWLGMQAVECYVDDRGNVVTGDVTALCYVKLPGRKVLQMAHSPHGGVVIARANRQYPVHWSYSG